MVGVPTGTVGSEGKLEDLSLLQDKSLEDRLDQHRSSMSTLGHTSSANSADTIEEVELLETSTSCSAAAAVAVVQSDKVRDVRMSKCVCVGKRPSFIPSVCVCVCAISLSLSHSTAHCMCV